MSNLKQIGLAFRMWGDENNDRYPTIVPIQNGGAEQWVYSQANPSLGNTMPAGYVAGYAEAGPFVVTSNTLDNPAAMSCPADSVAPHGIAATNWSVFFSGSSPSVAGYCSYFVGGDAVDTQPQSILAGDRNIGDNNGGAAGSSIPAPTMFNATLGTQAGNGPGAQGTGLPSTVTSWNRWAWSANDLHLAAGNLLLGDGSAQQTAVLDLQADLINATNNATAQPFYNFPN